MLALLGVVTVLDQTTVPAPRGEGELPGGGAPFPVTGRDPSTVSDQESWRALRKTARRSGQKMTSDSAFSRYPARVPQLVP